MGLFSKKEELPLDTIISQGTEVKGIIYSKGMVRIDGSVDGGISEAEGVVVGEQGKVKGDIRAKTIIVGGKITGNITAAQNIEMQVKAQVYGDIKAPQLSIAEGVIFEGNCTMSGERNKVIELEVDTKR